MQATHTDPPAAMEIRTAPHEVSSDWADFYPFRAGTRVFQNSVGSAATIASIQCGEQVACHCEPIFAELRSRLAIASHSEAARGCEVPVAKRLSKASQRQSAFTRTGSICAEPFYCKRLVSAGKIGTVADRILLLQGDAVVTHSKDGMGYAKLEPPD